MPAGSCRLVIDADYTCSNPSACVGRGCAEICNSIPADGIGAKTAWNINTDYLSCCSSTCIIVVQISHIIICNIHHVRCAAAAYTDNTLSSSGGRRGAGIYAIRG